MLRRRDLNQRWCRLSSLPLKNPSYSTMTMIVRSGLLRLIHQRGSLWWWLREKPPKMTDKLNRCSPEAVDCQSKDPTDYQALPAQRTNKESMPLSRWAKLKPYREPFHLREGQGSSCHLKLRKTKSVWSCQQATRLMMCLIRPNKLYWKWRRSLHQSRFWTFLNWPLHLLAKSQTCSIRRLYKRDSLVK